MSEREKKPYAEAIPVVFAGAVFLSFISTWLTYIILDDFLSHGNAGYDPKTVDNAYEKVLVSYLISAGVWKLFFYIAKDQTKR